jgi:hypothetical protein
VTVALLIIAAGVIVGGVGLGAGHAGLLAAGIVIAVVGGWRLSETGDDQW